MVQKKLVRGVTVSFLLAASLVIFGDPAAKAQADGPIVIGTANFSIEVSSGEAGLPEGCGVAGDLCNGLVYLGDFTGGGITDQAPFYAIASAEQPGFTGGYHQAVSHCENLSMRGYDDFILNPTLTGTGGSQIASARTNMPGDPTGTSGNSYWFDNLNTLCTQTETQEQCFGVPQTCYPVQVCTATGEFSGVASYQTTMVNGEVVSASAGLNLTTAVSQSHGAFCVRSGTLYMRITGRTQGVSPSSVIPGETVVISGASPQVISVSGPAEYRINSGPWTQSTGTVSNGDTLSVRVTAPSGFGASAVAGVTVSGITETVTLTTMPPVTLSLAQDAPPNVVTGYVGAAYSQDMSPLLNLGGGDPQDPPVAADVTWSATLPDGFSIDPSTGVVSGIFQAAGTYSLDVTASIGPISDTKTYEVTVTDLVLASNTLPDTASQLSVASFEKVGELYDRDATAYAYSSLSNPVSLNFPEEVLADGFSYRIQNTNRYAQNMSVEAWVNGAWETVYSTTVAAGSYNIISRITTPRVVMSRADFTQEVVSDLFRIVGSGSLNLSQFRIEHAGSSPEFPLTAILPDQDFTIAAEGAPWSQTLTLSVAGGSSLSRPSPAEFDWSVTSGAFPAGLTLDGSGTLAGAPSEGGSFSFTVQASHTPSGAVASGQISLLIGAPSFTGGETGSLVAAYGSGPVDLSALLEVNDPSPSDELTWTLLEAPTRGAVYGAPELILSSGSAVSPLSIIYTPPAVTPDPLPDPDAVDSFTIRVTDSDGSEDLITLSATLYEVPETVLSLAPDLPPGGGNGYVGTEYTQAFSGLLTVSGGDPFDPPTGAGVTWSATLPDGFSIDPSTGVVSGIFQAAGTYSLDVTATLDGISVSRSYSVSVIDGAPLASLVLPATSEQDGETSAQNALLLYEPDRTANVYSSLSSSVVLNFSGPVIADSVSFRVSNISTATQSVTVEAWVSGAWETVHSRTINGRSSFFCFGPCVPAITTATASFSEEVVSDRFRITGTSNIALQRFRIGHGG